MRLGLGSGYWRGSRKPISRHTGKTAPLRHGSTRWDAGCQLPTQVAEGQSLCFCGATTGIVQV